MRVSSGPAEPSNRQAAVIAPSVSKPGPAVPTSRTSESKRARSNGLRLSPSSTPGAQHPAYLTSAGVSWRRKRAPARVALQSSRAAPVRSRAGSCALLTVPIPSGYGPLATATNRKRCRSHGCSRRSSSASSPMHGPRSRSSRVQDALSAEAQPLEAQVGDRNVLRRHARPNDGYRAVSRRPWRTSFADSLGVHSQMFVSGILSGLAGRFDQLATVCAMMTA